MSDRVLVTGGAGFIGAHVAAECLRRGSEVVVLDDLSGGFTENVPPGAEFVHGSVTDDALVGRLFAQRRFRYVYHLAAYAAEGLSHFIRRFNYENNLGGSVNVVNACVKYEVECLVFTSSIAVYGRNQLPMSEDLVPSPEDPYGVSKYAVELDLRAAHEMFGLKSVVFRPHNVYGELQNIADRYRNVIGIFMNQVLSGRPMSVFGDGLQSRAFTHVSDVVGPIVESAGRPDCHGEVFNVGGDDVCTVLDLALKVAACLGVEPDVVHHPARNEVVHAFADHSKQQTFFGKGATVPLDQGLDRMARWVRSVGTRPPVSFSNIEIRKNLPPSWA